MLDSYNIYASSACETPFFRFLLEEGDFRRRLSQFVSSAPLNKLVIIEDYPESLNDRNVLNIGQVLSIRLRGIDRSNLTSFQFKVQSILDEIVKEYTLFDKDFGPLIIIRNIGILYEPTLRVNVITFFKNLSRNTLTFLLWPGEKNNNVLYFLKETSHNTIRQSEINYIIL